ncbi:transcription antitermination protein RfaH [bacterium BMS3Bbin10]|nr:transcription antitermination protein RfaH [bacterium BMS3Bbin10]
MKRWYVVHTQPRAEDRAQWHLENQGFDCFVPRCRRTRRHARRTDTVLEPLFPRYLFAYFDADASRWLAINSSRGVVALLTDGTRPLPIPSDIVEKLIAESDAQGVTPLASLGMFWKGRKVRIKSGPFAGQMGEVAEVFAKGRDRVHVLLSMLGVQTRMQLPSYALETA